MGTRGWRGAVARAWVLLGAAACTQNVVYDTPTAETLFYYPTHMALAADGQTLYVVSSNFDRRYRSGWITRIDLRQALPALAGPEPEAGAAALRAGASRALDVPALPGPLALTEDGRQAFVAHRGAGLFTAIDIAPDAAGLPQLACGAAAGGARGDVSRAQKNSACDLAHFVTLNEDAAALAAAGGPGDLVDPYAVAVVQEAPAVVAVGYLSSGSLTFVGRVPGAPPQVLGGLSQGVSATLALRAAAPVGGPAPMYGVGAVGLAYGGSASTLVAFDLSAARAAPGGFAPAAVVQAGVDLAGQYGSAQSVDVALSPDGLGLYLAQQAPDALVSLQAGAVLLPGGLPGRDRLRPELVDAASLARERPTGVAYVTRGPAQADFLAVTSLDRNALSFLVPAGAGAQPVRELRWTETGWSADNMAQALGPFAVQPVSSAGRTYLFVTSFYEHAVHVVDVSAADWGAFRDVAQIGNGGP